jgi:hypothetical protein
VRSKRRGDFTVLSQDRVTVQYTCNLKIGRAVHKNSQDFMIQFSFCAGENCGQATPLLPKRNAIISGGKRARGRRVVLERPPKLSLFGSVCVCESADRSWRVRGRGLKEKLHSKLLIYTTVYA